VPFDQARPVWVDDPSFDIERHVLLTAVPAPGGRRQVLDLMGRLQSIVLDRNKPLWEIYFVDGLEDTDTVAIVSKIHHSMIDGTSGVELATLLFDHTREGMPICATDWEPLPEPGPATLLFDAFVGRINAAYGNARKTARALRDLRQPATHVLKFARAMASFTSDFDALPFNARVGSRRAYEIASVPMSEVLDAKRALGVSVNDLVLAAITGALRRYCQENGIDPDELGRIKAICPVDNRAPGDLRPGSDVSSMIVDLPVSEPDLATRVAAIGECSRTLKELDVADGANMWARLTSLLPATLLRATSWLQFRGLMGNANLLVSNVRGPDRPFYCFGGKVHAFHPYFGVQDGLGLNVVVFSYDGQLLIGLAADPELVPDLDSVAEGIAKSFGEVVAIA
jgi:WS/DGAT/MGAT family acyltransferase